MKLSALAVTLFAATALVGGTAAAQAMAPAATMQPIPNPPEKGGKMMHGKMMHGKKMHGKMGKHMHHKMKAEAKSDADKGAMAAPKEDSAAPAATDDTAAKPMKHHAMRHHMMKKSAAPGDTTTPAPAAPQ